MKRIICAVFLFSLLAFVGCAGGWGHQVVIYDYSTIVEPAQSNAEEAVRVRPDQPRVYGPGVFDDPTVVVFKNSSDVITYEIFVDNEQEGTVLLPGHTSPLRFLPVGRHSVVAKGRRTTLQFGEIRLPDRIFFVTIRSRGRAQIISLC